MNMILNALNVITYHLSLITSSEDNFDDFEKSRDMSTSSAQQRYSQQQYQHQLDEDEELSIMEDDAASVPQEIEIETTRPTIKVFSFAGVLLLLLLLLLLH